VLFVRRFKRRLKKLGVVEWSKKQEEHFTSSGFGVSSNRDAVDILKLLGNPPKTVLDVGCNDAGLVKKLRDAGFNVYGIDLPIVIKKAIEKYPELGEYLFPCNLEFDVIKAFTDKFDFIIAYEVIEHVVNDWKMVRGLYTYLKVDGQLYLTTRSNAREVEGMHIKHYDKDELKNMATDIGFKIIYLNKSGGGLTLYAKKNPCL